MKPTRNALILGASGMTGVCLLSRLLADGNYQQVYAAVRRPLKTLHSKLHEWPIDGSILSPDAVAGGDVFCCLGTTMAKAGSKEAFRAVDYDLPLRWAREAKAAGMQRFFLISAMGANANSRIFYNCVKGELERELEGIGFESLLIFRPGLLLGERSEKRPGEQFAKRLFAVLNPLLPMAWKGIPHDRVAESMLKASTQDWKGLHIFSNADMIKGL
jgi:uncharacterized protein YbjT (DUF2867 family)